MELLKENIAAFRGTNIQLIPYNCECYWGIARSSVQHQNIFASLVISWYVLSPRFQCPPFVSH